jgi:cbb3-type cytochrome oxidase subunit 3
MAWTVAAMLAALLLLQFSLFWRTLREQREMTRFLMLVLADEQSHAGRKS